MYFAQAVVAVALVVANSIVRLSWLLEPASLTVLADFGLVVAVVANQIDRSNSQQEFAIPIELVSKPE